MCTERYRPALPEASQRLQAVQPRHGQKPFKTPFPPPYEYECLGIRLLDKGAFRFERPLRGAIVKMASRSFFIVKDEK
jgi:hypothetical protein